MLWDFGGGGTASSLASLNRILREHYPSRFVYAKSERSSRVRLQVEHGRVRTVHPNQPERPAQSARAGRGACELYPSAVLFVGLIGIDEDVAIAIVRTGRRHGYLLVPAVLSADRVRLHRKHKVLVHTCILPVNARRIRILTGKWPDPMNLPHHPLPGSNLLQVDQSARPALVPNIFLQAPAPETARISVAAPAITECTRRCQNNVGFCHSSRPLACANRNAE